MSLDSMKRFIDDFEKEARDNGFVQQADNAQRVRQFLGFGVIQSSYDKESDGAVYDTAFLNAVIDLARGK